MQRDILSSLEGQGGRATTDALMLVMSPGREVSEAFRTSFYRALRGLEKKGQIWWDKKHGSPKSAYGMVSSRRKRVLLIDVDSTILNIALAKISSYHKSLGDVVELQKGQNVASRLVDYDEVYISCVFTESADAARRLAKQFPNSNVHLGGSGVDLVTKLPPEIESLKPDNSIYHDIYPETRYTSYGFVSRGCIRKCPFCIVPNKEGKIHPVGDLYSIWNREAEHTHVVFLDNNILALPEHFEKIADQIISEGLVCDWNQAFDARLLTPENASIIKNLKFSLSPRFAFDDIKLEPQVRRGIEILKNAGVNRSMFYVLCGFNSSFEDDLRRVNILRDLKQIAFVMLYNKEELLKQPRYRHLRNWANARAHYGTQTYDEYCSAQEDGAYRKISNSNRYAKKMNGRHERKLDNIRDART